MGASVSERRVHGLRLTHAVARYDDRASHKAASDEDVVRLHFSLRGRYRRVGLNEYKLKRGFRELFGTTVFAYLSEQRLALAKRMLLDTDKTAAEIAFELGYATPQHFSAAFKKRFGVSPKSMRKNP
jgi:AraC-like DNA-binding protein